MTALEHRCRSRHEVQRPATAREPMIRATRPSVRWAQSLITLCG